MYNEIRLRYYMFYKERGIFRLMICPAIFQFATLNMSVTEQTVLTVWKRTDEKTIEVCY